MSVNYSGLVVAGIGFFLTRFTVSLAIHEDPLSFVLVGVVPLTLGLGLSAFGVALTVADVEASTVRTTALWCAVGAGGMLVLVVLTLLGSSAAGAETFGSPRSRAYLANFLIGGSVGGTLTGLYASRNQRQRGALSQQANRLAILNRLLRHEVLNAVTVIRGYASLPDDDVEARAVIEDRSDAIERTIEEVKYLTRRAGTGESPDVLVDLEDCLRESVRTVQERYPAVDVSVGDVAGTPMVPADDRLAQVFTHLLENAVTHGGDDSPSVEVTTTRDGVRVAVSDEGDGLPAGPRRLLETGDIEEFDDPTTGFGLNVVRLLVEGYRGEVEADVGETGTTVTVVLPRAEAGGGPRPSRADLGGVRPAVPHLAVTLVAAVLAGVCYGVVAEWLGGSIAGIGVFYGTANATVGWITHEFHSVVFGFVFVSLVALVPERFQGDVRTYAAVGVGWALVLWLLAAGVVAPVWLRLLDIPAPLPNLSSRLLATHLVWGLSLGLFTAVGYTYLTPGVARLGDRLRGDSDRA